MFIIKMCIYNRTRGIRFRPPLVGRRNAVFGMILAHAVAEAAWRKESMQIMFFICLSTIMRVLLNTETTVLHFLLLAFGKNFNNRRYITFIINQKQSCPRSS